MAIVSSTSTAPISSGSEKPSNALKPVSKTATAPEPATAPAKTASQSTKPQQPMTPTANAITAQAKATAAAMGQQYREVFAEALTEEFASIFNDFIPAMDQQMAAAIDVTALEISSGQHSLQGRSMKSIEGGANATG